MYGRGKKKSHSAASLTSTSAVRLCNNSTMHCWKNKKKKNPTRHHEIHYFPSGNAAADELQVPEQQLPVQCTGRLAASAFSLRFGFPGERIIRRRRNPACPFPSRRDEHHSSQAAPGRETRARIITSCCRRLQGDAEAVSPREQRVPQVVRVKNRRTFPFFIRFSPVKPPRRTSRSERLTNGT